jgi:hypothetical protein
MTDMTTIASMMSARTVKPSTTPSWTTGSGPRR